jgi:predicted nucleic acid-binding protein
VKELVAALRQVATIVVPTETLAVSPHEADNRFLECAEAAQADFLTADNKRHPPAGWKGARLVNAREFFKLIDLETDEPA